MRAGLMTQRVKQWADDALTSAKPVIQDNETTTDLVVDGSPVITVSEIDATAAAYPANSWPASGRHRLKTPCLVGIVTGMHRRRDLSHWVGNFDFGVNGPAFVRRQELGDSRGEQCDRETGCSRSTKIAKLTGMVAEGAMGGWVHTLFTGSDGAATY